MQGRHLGHAGIHHFFQPAAPLGSACDGLGPARTLCLCSGTLLQSVGSNQGLKQPYGIHQILVGCHPTVFTPRRGDTVDHRAVKVWCRYAAAESLLRSLPQSDTAA